MFIAISEGNMGKYSDQLASMFKLRKDVFVDRLGWELQHTNEEESDQYDNPNAVYLVLENSFGQAVACARMLPTATPNLLGNTFPELVDGPPPASPHIWEVTRLAVDHRKERLASVIGIRNIPGALWCCLMEFGIAMGAENLVSVSDVRIEPIMKRAGWEINRLGGMINIAGCNIVGEISPVSYRVLSKLRSRCKINGPVLNTGSIDRAIIPIQEGTAA